MVKDIETQKKSKQTSTERNKTSAMDNCAADLTLKRTFVNGTSMEAPGITSGLSQESSGRDGVRESNQADIASAIPDIAPSSTILGNLEAPAENRSNNVIKKHIGKEGRARCKSPLQMQLPSSVASFAPADIDGFAADRDVRNNCCSKVETFHKASTLECRLFDDSWKSRIAN